MGDKNSLRKKVLEPILTEAPRMIDYIEREFSQEVGNQQPIVIDHHHQGSSRLSLVARIDDDEDC